MTESKRSGTVRISFNSQVDKDNGFFELIQESGSGFMGVGKNEFIVSQDQCKLLKDKQISFTEIKIGDAKNQSRYFTAQTG
jgi:hypothetical protein